MASCSKGISFLPQRCQAPWISPDETIFLLHLRSTPLTLCLVVSPAPLLLHAVCCFSRYPSSPASLGNICARFLLSLYLKWTNLLGCSPSLSYLLIFLQQIIIKLFIKKFICNRACDQKICKLCTAFALVFVIVLVLSLSPLAHSVSLLGRKVFLWVKLTECCVLYVVLFIFSQAFLYCFILCHSVALSY